MQYSILWTYSPIFHKYHILKFLDNYKYYIAMYMFKNKNSSQFRTIHEINTIEIDIWPRHRLTVSLPAKIRYHSWDLYLE